ncbi:MAG: murein transglycosylase, partial [Desulfobacula sp.]|nr:murein transglycosylase [Desulfobacula sp.]
VEVTALRSIATDTALFPKGALCFIQSKLPDRSDVNFLSDNNSFKEWKNTSFFVLNQDTGGAIKGPARADLFCGNGDYAQFTAGHMNQYGRLFFLVLNPES